MKKEKLLQYLYWGKHSKEIYNENSVLVNENNLKRLNILASIQGVLNFIVLLINTLPKQTIINNVNHIYLFNTLISIIIIIVVNFIFDKKYKEKYVNLAFYVYLAFCLLAYKEISLNNVTSNSGVMCGVYIIFAIMIDDRPIVYSLFTILMTLGICINVFSLKPYEFAIIDIVNYSVFAFISCLIQIYITGERLEKQMLIKEIASQRDTDFLTKLANRSLIENGITESLLKNPGEKSALIVIDLDNFKKANDKYGHIYGDKILVEVSKILKSIFKNSEFVSRIGGDEFVIFISDFNSKNKIIEKINLVIEKINNINLDDHHIIGCSIGMAISQKGDNNYYDLFEKADKAMYQAKKEGKNTYKIN